MAVLTSGVVDVLLRIVLNHLGRLRVRVVRDGGWRVRSSIGLLLLMVVMRLMCWRRSSRRVLLVASVTRRGRKQWLLIRLWADRGSSAPSAGKAVLCLKRLGPLAFLTLFGGVVPFLTIAARRASSAWKVMPRFAGLSLPACESGGGGRRRTVARAGRGG